MSFVVEGCVADGVSFNTAVNVWLVVGDEVSLNTAVNLWVSTQSVGSTDTL